MDMAQHEEPMDIDSSVCDFDNKENAFHHNQVLQTIPCTEKGYEELDVSELNMKLRYSITPASSPMSKSYTANCLDNKILDVADNTVEFEGNLTRSMNSTLTRNDGIRSSKLLPLQSLPAEHGLVDTNRSALRPLDSTVAITVSGPCDIDDNISLPSTSSSIAHTPEATTPTKELPDDGGSPIVRGLKSVLNMFRPSQSPIPGAKNETDPIKSETLSPPIVISPENLADRSQVVLASTPLSGHKTKNTLLTRNNEDNLIFNEDLEKELQWKDETTIIFSTEKIPIHKLFFQTPKPEGKEKQPKKPKADKLDSSVEYMDISYNDAMNKTLEGNEAVNKSKVTGIESDSEFVDCESTFNKSEYQLDQSFKSQEIDLNIAKNTLSLADNTSTFKDPVSNDSKEILAETMSMKSSNMSKESAEEISTSEHKITTDIKEFKHEVVSVTEELETAQVPTSTDLVEPQLHDNNFSNNAISPNSDAMSVKCSDMLKKTAKENSTFEHKTASDVKEFQKEVDSVTEEQDIAQVPISTGLLEPQLHDNNFSNNAIYSDVMSVKSSNIAKETAEENSTYEQKIAADVEKFKQEVDSVTEEQEIAQVPISIGLLEPHCHDNNFSNNVIDSDAMSVKSNIAKETAEENSTFEHKIATDVKESKQEGDSVIEEQEIAQTPISIDLLEPQLHDNNFSNNAISSDTNAMSAQSSNMSKDTAEENITFKHKIATDVREFKQEEDTVTEDQEIAQVSISTDLLEPQLHDNNFFNNVIDSNALSANEDSDKSGKHNVVSDIDLNLEVNFPNSMTSSDIKYDSKVVGSIIQCNETSVSNSIKIVKNESDNVVVSSISQIPLICDPRVLLFNIPSENVPVIETVSQDKNVTITNPVMNSSPADIPLPEDDDIEKISLDCTLVEKTGKAIDIDFIEKIKNNNVNILTMPEPVEFEHVSNIKHVGKLEPEVHSLNPLPEMYNAEHDFIFDNVQVSDALDSAIVAVERIVEAVKTIDTKPLDINYSNLDDTNILLHMIENVVNDGDCSSQAEAMKNIGENAEIHQLQSAKTFVDNEKPYEKSEVKIENCPENMDIAAPRTDKENVGIVETKVNERVLNEEPKFELCLTQDQDKESENILQTFAEKEQIETEGVKNCKENIDAINHKHFMADETFNAIAADDSNKEVKILEKETLEITTDFTNTIECETVPLNTTNVVNIQEKSIEVNPIGLTQEEKNYRMEKSLLEEPKIEPELKLFKKFSIMNNPARVEEIKIDTLETKVTENKTPVVISETNTIDKSVHESAIFSIQSTESHGQTYIDTVAQCLPIDHIIVDKECNNQIFNNLEQIENPVTKHLEFADQDGSSVHITSEVTETEGNAIIDDEIALSESNSPFVSVSAVVETVTDDHPSNNVEQIGNSLKTEQEEARISRPGSPKIVSKGYNLNFDEIEDPFGTKTRIRSSPPPSATQNQLYEQTDTFGFESLELPKKELNKDRRRSQPMRRKPVGNKKLNATFNGTSKSNTENLKTETVTDKTKIRDVKEQKNKVPIENMEVDESFCDQESASLFVNKIAINNKNENPRPNLNIDTGIDISEEDTITEQLKQLDIERPNKSLVETAIVSSAETFYTTEASSSGRLSSKSSYNIPEINDANFNPFATKAKVCQSPPPSLDSPFVSKSKLRRSPVPSIAPMNDNINNATTFLNNSTEKSPRNEESDISNSTKNTDKDDITREVNTEDEDTIEGPFLEAEDLQNNERKVPVAQSKELPANIDDKIFNLDSENIDMMHFTELPPGNEENADGEFFIDADAFEFLLNQNPSNTVADSGKESLFLKFDPLFANRVSSDGVVAALKNVQKRQSTPKKTPQPPQNDATFITQSPIAGSSTFNVSNGMDITNTTEDSIDDLNITVAKPMMVVTPAVNPVFTPRNRMASHLATNRRSLTITSPAIAVIDRLLSNVSANDSAVAHEITIAEATRENNEADFALTQLQKLLADKEVAVYNLRTETNELRDKLASMESRVKSLEAISEERLKKINELTETLQEKTKQNNSMVTVLQDYERTIASLIAKNEQDKKQHAEERIQLIKERDEQTVHLASMEVSFNDLHSKYEKNKQIILGFKANEDIFKKSYNEFEEKISKMQNIYEQMKQHATSKLNQANEELQKTNRAHEAEVLKLNAMIKRKDLHIKSLEETVQQKTKANEELTAICDELINKVSSR